MHTCSNCGCPQLPLLLSIFAPTIPCLPLQHTEALTHPGNRVYTVNARSSCLCTHAYRSVPSSNSTVCMHTELCISFKAFSPPTSVKLSPVIVPRRGQFSYCMVRWENSWPSVLVKSCWQVVGIFIFQVLPHPG